jgi:anti-sigma-K factor RskA
MNCDEVRDLTGAYALGSVSPEEKRQIEDHLEDCDLHDEIAGLTATAMGLGSAALELEPPAGLGGRISAAIQAEPDVAVTRPVDRPIWQRVKRIASWPVAAALFIAVGALVIWNIDLQLEDREDNLVHFVKEADGDWVRIEATLGQAGSTVSLGGFEPLPSDRDYQLWTVRDDVAISLGVFEPDAKGDWSGKMDFALLRGDVIAITEEVKGGADAPTMDPLLSTQI